MALVGFTGYFIAACWIVFLVYWGITAFFAKKTVQGGNWQWRIIVMVVLFVVFYTNQTNSAVGVLNHRLWEYSLPVGVSADVLAAIGLAVLLWARTVLGRNWSGYVAFKENHELVTTGPYAYIRHPIYTGLLLLALGTALVNGHVSGLVFLAVFLVIFLWRIPQEEQLMMTHFSAEYGPYKARTKALIPWVV